MLEDKPGLVGSANPGRWRVVERRSEGAAAGPVGGT